MNISRDPVATKENTIELAFTRPIDVKKAQIALKNTKNKKAVVVQEIKSSPEDLRVVLVVVKNKMELGVPYELTLKKIASLDGAELPPENRVPLKVVYNGELPSL
jgi:pyruvate/2-oxoacid:ferredoxin oxidoreductase alpha subunit